MAAKKETNIQRKERAVVKLREAMRQDQSNKKEMAYKLYMEALQHAGVYFYLEKMDMQKFVNHYKNAKKIRDTTHVQESHLSHEAVVGLGLAADLPLTLSDVKLSDVGGLAACKKLLKEAAILPIEFPHFFTGNRKPWKAILLYGPPGTGKTRVANAIATEAGAKFFSVSASDLVSKWMGESEKEVSKLFRFARENAPSIIFIDEIDSLCGSRGKENENEASRRIKTEFFVQMQAVANYPKNVLVLAATNTPYDLDMAMRRRFDKRIYIPLPEEEERKEILELHIGIEKKKKKQLHIGKTHNLSTEDFQDLASKTKGFSGSDISIFVKDALYQPVRATVEAKFFKEISGMWVPWECKEGNAMEVTLEELKKKVGAEKIQPPPATKADFVEVLKNQKRTVSKADVEKCEKFAKEFGNDG